MIKKKIPYLLLLLIIPVLGLIYTILNTHPKPAVEIPMALDHHIPFIPIFIIPYVIWYAFIFGYLVYFCFKNTKVYVLTLITITIGELICFTIYFFFQTYVPRPELTGNGVITQMVQFIYQNDEPYNCFPSIHALTTFSIVYASIYIKNKNILNTIFLQSMGILIILSTLFVKQHVVWDVVASIAMVPVIYTATVFAISAYRKPRVTARTRPATRRKKAARLLDL